MKTRHLHSVAAALVASLAVGACDREGPASPAAPSSSSAELSPPVQNPPRGADTTPMPPPLPPSSAESDAGTAPDAPTTAQDPPAPGSAAPPAMPSEGAGADADRAFVATVVARSQAKVEAAQLVAREGQSPQVRDFAEQLQRDYTALNERLTQLAASRQMPVSEAMPETARADLTELEKVTGAELDALFLSRVGVAAHKESIDLFEQHARDGADPELREFAREHLEMLRRHEETAQSLQPKLADEPR